MASIAAITFDLWQTLLLDRPEVGQVRTLARLEGTGAALRKAGKEYPAAIIEEAYQKCARRCQQIREGLADISFRKQVELFVEGISPGLAARLPAATMDEIARAYSDSFFLYPPVPHPNGLETLAAVKEMGLTIGMISNTGMTPGVSFRRFLQEHGMLDYFAALTFSDEALVAKPSPAIFLMTLQALGVDPEQTIHVGDHPNNDVAGAKGCGLKAVWIEGFYDLPEPSEPNTEPDVTVPSLAQVVPAVRELLAASNQRLPDRRQRE